MPELSKISKSSRVVFVPPADHIMAALDQRVQERGYQGVATELAELGHKVSRPTVSTVHRRVFTGYPHALVAAVEAVYCARTCTHTHAHITLRDCALTRSQVSPPLHNPSKLKHWQACQTCCFNQTHQTRRVGNASLPTTSNVRAEPVEALTEVTA